MNENITPASMLRVGAILDGKYRIDRYLSSGGFGNTYVAINEFGEQVAIKEFFLKGINHREENNTTVSVSNSENRDQFDQQRAKFKKEAMRLRGLHSRHIVKVLSFFEENGTSYYVMDYINGESLSQRLQRTGQPIPEPEVSAILSQVLDALEETHGKAIFHLDLKPGNIMVDQQGQVRLIDFGASKQSDSKGGVTVSTAAAFTREYAPLEQIEGRLDKIGPWTDFYALGATLYRILTNQKPPQYSDIQDEGEKAFNWPANIPISTEMRQIAQWLMLPNRTQRPQSVAAIRQRLSNQPESAQVSDQHPIPHEEDVTIIKESPSGNQKKHSQRNNEKHKDEQKETTPQRLKRVSSKKLREWAEDPKQKGKRFAIKRLGTTLYTTTELQGLSLYESDEIRLSTGSTWRHLGLLVNNYTRVAPAVSQTGGSAGTTGRDTTNSSTGSNSSGSTYGTGASSGEEQNNSSVMGWLIGIIVAVILMTLVATRGCTGTAESVDDSYTLEPDSAAAFLSDSAEIYNAIENRTFNGRAGCQYEDGWYYGNFKNGLPEGNGKFCAEKTGYQYEGNWHNGKKEGKGSESFSHATKKDEMVGYEGDFKNGVREGKGTAYYNDKTYQTGTWKNNELKTITDEGTWDYQNN